MAETINAISKTLLPVIYKGTGTSYL